MTFHDWRLLRNALPPWQFGTRGGKRLAEMRMLLRWMTASSPLYASAG